MWDSNLVVISQQSLLITNEFITVRTPFHLNIYFQLPWINSLLTLSTFFIYRESHSIKNWVYCLQASWHQFSDNHFRNQFSSKLIKYSTSRAFLGVSNPLSRTHHSRAFLELTNIYWEFTKPLAFFEEFVQD